MITNKLRLFFLPLLSLCYFGCANASLSGTVNNDSTYINADHSFQIALPYAKGSNEYSHMTIADGNSQGIKYVDIGPFVNDQNIYSVEWLKWGVKKNWSKAANGAVNGHVKQDFAGSGYQVLTLTPMVVNNRQAVYAVVKKIVPPYTPAQLAKLKKSPIHTSDIQPAVYSVYCFINYGAYIANVEAKVVVLPKVSSPSVVDLTHATWQPFKTMLQSFKPLVKV